MSGNLQMPALSLSDSPDLEYVLADIPFFCTGLTSLAVFAFFIVMRKINLPAIYLYVSTLLAFGAAILDLSQILLRGASNTNAGLALDTVTGIVNTREVGFALAFGFRYLYLWAYVSQRPRYEPRPSSTIDPLSTARKFHSASWERWGVPGLLLKYVLLGAVISIPILQILWRIATGNSAVYIAESTIQIAVSVMFMAKILLNLFLSTVAPWWRPFLPYIVPMLALIISAALGTGNVLVFKFSECTLGRFLQAVETYSLLVSLLIFAFYNVPKYKPAPPVTARTRSSFFTGVPKSVDAFANYQPQVVSPAKREETNVGLIVEPIERPFAAAYDRPVSRESRISRIGSWVLTPRRKAPRPPSVETRLWDSNAAELGISTEVRSTSQGDNEEVLVLSPRVQILDEKPPRLPRVKIQETERPSRTEPAQEKQKEKPKRPPLSLRTIESEDAPPTTAATLELGTPTDSRPFTGVSFSSYYGMATTSRLLMPAVTPGEQSARSTDSPVYGLDGIIPPSAPAAPESPILSPQNSKEQLRAISPIPPPAALAPSPSPRPPPSPSLAPSEVDQRASANSFDELLRQQTELDKSIAALRLFTPSSPAGTLQPPPEPSTARESKFTDPRSVSMSSNRSEFSLSIFPDPPLVDRTGGLPESLLPATRRPQSFVPRNAVDSQVTTDGLSAPGSPALVPVHGRFGSQGTQYDVTSFIGDLTVPGVNKGSGLYDLSETPETESQSDVETPVITAVQPNFRPFLLNSTSPAMTSIPSTGSSPPSGTSPSSAGTSYEYPVLKPLLLGNSTPAVPSPLSAGARRTPGQSISSTTSTRKPSRRGGERPLISVPRQLETELDDSAASEAFEKPRRPPQVR